MTVPAPRDMVRVIQHSSSRQSLISIYCNLERVANRLSVRVRRYSAFNVYAGTANASGAPQYSKTNVCDVH